VWSARRNAAFGMRASFRPCARPRDSGSWLWMYAPESASAAELRAYRWADRYSAAEIRPAHRPGGLLQRRAEIWRSLPFPASGMLP